jgi:hypothetical protein
MEKHYFSKKNLRNGIMILFLGIILIIGGCYEWKSIIQPTTANPNSSFEVKMTLQRPASEEPSADPISAYAYLGIILPDGWSVKDSIVFEKLGQTAEQTVKDTVVFNAEHATKLTADTMKVPAGYHWWAGKTLRPVEMIGFTTATLNVTILTDAKLGEFKLKYVLGDDEGELPRFPYSDRAISNFIPITIENSTYVKDLWQKENWQVYPNPSYGKVFVEQAELSGSVKMRVYDLNGKVLKQEVLRQNNTEVNLQSLPKGSYIIALEKNGVIKSKTITMK